MKRRNFSLFALVLISGISCAQGNGFVGDPMEAESVAPGDQAEAVAIEEAEAPFADMDMSADAILAMGDSDSDSAAPAGETDPLAFEDHTKPLETTAEAAVPPEPETTTTVAAVPVEPAPAQPKKKPVTKPKKKFPKAESVPVVVRDPMEPGPEEEEVVASPELAPEDTLGAVDEVVAVADPQPIQSPLEEEVAMDMGEPAEPMEASTGLTGFVNQHPWVALLGLFGLLGGSILLYWGRNRPQA